MKIAVTGASGFVGRAVCAEVLREGHIAIPLVRRPAGLANEIVIGDISRNVLPTIEADTVIHLAARAHVMKHDPATADQAYREANVEGTRRAIEMAKAAGARRFVFVSSIKALGERTQMGKPLTEQDTPAPEDAYGRSKLAAERLAQDMTSRLGIDLVIVRPPLVYGPGVKGNFATLIRLSCLGIPLPIGSINNQRSMISLANLANLLVHVAVHSAAAGRTILASDLHDVSTPELVRAIAAAAKRKAHIAPFPLGLMSFLARMLGKGDMFTRLAGNLQVDGRGTLKDLEWLPVQTVDDGIRSTVQAFKS
jgi:nucleoside-diphosphate-sugar epimerase